MFYKVNIKLDQIVWRQLGLQFYLSHPVLFFHRKPYNIRWEIKFKINFCCCNDFKDVKSINELFVISIFQFIGLENIFQTDSNFPNTGQI